MGSNDSKLCYDHIPFIDNAGPTEIVRKTERCDPLYGPSLMPYKGKDFCRDAIGRLVVVDGIGYFGRFSRNSIISRVFIHKVEINTNFSIGMVLWYTDKLNKAMCNLDLEALWVIDSHNVAIFTSNPSCKFAERSISTIGIEETIASLDDGPNRPTKAQLIEGLERMEDSFSKYGVGALVKCEEGFDYRILVPNEDEYMKFQEKYDEIETNLKKAKYDRIEKERKSKENAFHAKTKCTRSGKNFDDGRCDRYRMLIIRSRRRHLKREKADKAAEAAEAADTTIKRTRSGKKYDGLCDISRVLLNRYERKKRKKEREKLAATNAINASGVGGAASGAASGSRVAASGAGSAASGAAIEAVVESSAKKARIDNGSL
jgi:hypothetical protein